MDYNGLLSQTQVLPTKIVELCSEICNIKNSQIKYHLCDKGSTNNITTNLAKISNIHHSHNPVSLDTCASHDQHGGNSSHNTPSSPSHPRSNGDTAPPCEPLPSHTWSSPAPPEGGVLYMSPLLSSLLAEDTSVSVGVLSWGGLSAGEGWDTSNPVWSKGWVEGMWMGRVMEEFLEALGIRNDTKIPLFSPNSLYLLHLCSVILFCLPLLH